MDHTLLFELGHFKAEEGELNNNALYCKPGKCPILRRMLDTATQRLMDKKSLNGSEGVYWSTGPKLLNELMRDHGDNGVQVVPADLVQSSDQSIIGDPLAGTWKSDGDGVPAKMCIGNYIMSFHAHGQNGAVGTNFWRIKAKRFLHLS